MYGFRHQIEANFFLGLVSVEHLKCRFLCTPSHVLETSLQGPESFVDSVGLVDPLEPQNQHNRPQDEP